MTAPATPADERLLPCPFCGSDEIAEGYDTKGNSAFTCEECGAGTAWDPTAVARAAWNRRSSPSVESVRRMREALEPFARAAERLDEGLPPDLLCEDSYTIEAAFYEVEQPTVGDLRRARAAFTALPGEDNPIQGLNT